MIKKLLYMSFVFALLTGITAPITAKADTKLDEIEEYNITVDMENDSSMDITYHIDWKVLNDSSEGPLTWVKIGIPNNYVSDICALSSNINNIYYYSDGGDYVRIDLDKSYYAGEIVTLDFSVRQSNVHTLNSDLCYFNFTPGWFDGIEVKSMTIMWNDKGALYSDAPDNEGNYYMWTTSLAAGERFTATVVYSKDAFDTVTSGTPASYTSSYSGNPDSTRLVMYIIIAVLAVAMIILRIVIGGSGRYYGGFGSHGGHHFGGGGCACAGCACACACAGGGRAGCSAKNFYRSAAQLNRFKLVLQENSKTERACPLQPGSKVNQ